MRTRLGTPGAANRVARSAEAGGVVRSLIGSLLLLALLAAGLLVAWATTKDFARTIASRSWPATECLILSSGVTVPGDGEEEFVFRARYRYAAGGVERTGETVRFGYTGSGESADAYRMAAAYPAGARVTCWVDPEDPSVSFLERRNLWHGLVILASLPFVLIGTGGLWLLWGGRFGRRDGRPVPSPAERLGRKWTGGSSGCLAAFFSVFLIAGLGVLWLMLIGPAIKAWNAREWVPTSCEVVSSRVETHPSDEGEPTYSVEVLYRYRVEGREYHSDRYHFHTGSTSGYEAKARVVERLPAGTRFTCYVDPGDPAEAVIERGLGNESWFSLFALIFVAVGAGGMFFALTAHRRQERGGKKGGGRRGRSGESSGDSAGGSAADGSLVLEPAMGPWTKLLVLILIAAFWNGITGVFVWQAIEGWRAGAPDGCLTVIMIPFATIGILLLVSVPYSILALANPRPRLILTPGRLTPGGRAEVAWRFTGATRRIRRLRLRLEAEESNSTGSGKNRRTTTRPLHSQLLFETEQPARIENGHTAFVLYENAPPTRTGEPKVTWKLTLRGEIRLWPDVNESFEIEVSPGPRRPRKKREEPGPTEPPQPPAPADPGPPIPAPPDDAWAPPPAPLPEKLTL